MKDLEDIIEEVGGQGAYQRRLLYLVLSPVFLLLPLSWNAEVFFLNVPNHWCHHSMTNHLNETALNSWKQCFLIEKEDGSYDGCKIPVPNITNLDSFWNMSLSVETIMEDTCPARKWDTLEGYDSQPIINTTCGDGWRFDTSEFTRTIPTDQKWVCNEDHDYVADLYTYGKAGGMIGGVLFSYIGDKIGRRLTFSITIAMICLFMTMKTFLVDYYALYVVLKFVVASCYPATYNLPVTLIMEVTNPEYRSWTVMVTLVMW